MGPEQRPVAGRPVTSGAADDVVLELVGDRLRPGRARRRSGPPVRTWLLVVLAAVVLTAVVTYLLATQVESSGAPDRSSRYFSGRAAEREVVDTVTADGRVEHERETTVVPTAADNATLIVTDLRSKAGDRIDEGAVPVVVAGRPVIVLAGATPAYRDLAPGDSGADVGQLQEALRRQGLTVNDPAGPAGPTYGPSTAAAVAGLYERLGFSATLSSPDAASQVRQAASAVSDAQAALRSAQRALDQATPESQADLADARDAAARSLRSAQESYADLVLRTGAKVPRSEVVFVPEVPATITQVPGRVGLVLQAGEPALTLASGPVLVRAEVPSARRGEIRQGQRARLSVGGADPVDGTVTTVSEPSVPAGTQDAGASGMPVRVEVAPAQALTVPVGTAVTVAIELAASDGPTLAVPVAAVDQRPDGSQRVRVLRDGSPRSVAVRVGVSGDGWVAVRPSRGGLVAGDRVVLGVRRSP